MASGWPATPAASLRSTAVRPWASGAHSSAASIRSGANTAAASARPPRATLTISRAVWVRSSVLPMRAAASFSRPGPG